MKNINHFSYHQINRLEWQMDAINFTWKDLSAFQVTYFTVKLLQCKN